MNAFLSVMCTARSRWAVPVLLCGFAALGGCSKHGPSGKDGQVAARVNDGEISVHQVQAVMQAQPGLVQQYGDASAQRILDSLIEQELAAQAARKAGLDNNAKVLQAMELAKREVLARAYQDRLAEAAVLPDTPSVERYYDEHPELFANRKQYYLQETLVRLPADEVADFKARIDKLETLASVEAAVTEWPHASRNFVQMAEAIPAGLLKELVNLRDGRSIVMPRPDGVAVLTLVKSESVPMARAAATQAITAALLNTKKRALVEAGMSELRKSAKIQRADAPPASAAGTSGAAAAAPAAVASAALAVPPGASR